MKIKWFGIALAVSIVAGIFAPQISFAADATNSISSQRYKIAVCDWMILKRQKLGAFQLTKDIGADGVEVDMGSLGTNDTFESVITTNAEVRQQFLDARGELLPRFRPPPMVASFMLDQPASTKREQIPVPKGPVEVW